MNAPPQSLPITLRVSDRRSMDTELNRAIRAAIVDALKDGTRGILVTRHDTTTFTVELSHDVPVGQTLERDRRASSNDG